MQCIAKGAHKFLWNSRNNARLTPKTIMYGNRSGIPWAAAKVKALITTPAKRPHREAVDPWIIPRNKISSQRGVNTATARNNSAASSGVTSIARDAVVSVFPPGLLPVMTKTSLCALSSLIKIVGTCHSRCSSRQEGRRKPIPANVVILLVKKDHRAGKHQACMYENRYDDHDGTCLLQRRCCDQQSQRCAENVLSVLALDDN